jgi:hypothetical protein
VTRPFATLVGIALAVCSANARADDKDACIGAHERGQSLRNEGHLRAARAELLVCARDGCPQLITADCRPWLNAVNEDLPSVVLAVRDENGVETSSVRVSIDGALLAASLDGRPLDVDPGDHLLRFERAGQTAIEQRVFVRVREKERVVQLTFAPTSRPEVPPAAQEAPPSGSRWSAGVIVSGLLGVAGLGAFAIAGVTGKVAESDLASSGCKPNCDAGKIDDVRAHYVVAYASLGAGVVGLGVATGLFLSRPRSPATMGGLDHLLVTPVAGGLTAGWSGHF